MAITPTSLLNIASNDTITVELFYSGWGNPPFDGSTGLVQTFQGRLDGVNGILSNGADPVELSLHVMPLGWNAPIVKDLCPCADPTYPNCDPLYGCVGPNHTPNSMATLNANRNDYIFFGFSDIRAVDVSRLNIAWAATINASDGQTAGRCSGGGHADGPCTTNAECPGGTCNLNFPWYSGTLNLRAGANVCGTTTFTLVADVNNTFISNAQTFAITALPAIVGLTLVAGSDCDCNPSDGCDDSNPCTDDLCVNQECLHVPNTSGCSDGNICTTGDFCLNGACLPGNPTDCSGMGETCNDASCDPLGPLGNCNVQTPKANGAACSDGIFCDGFERCFDGICVPGEPPCPGGLGCREANQDCSPCESAADCEDGFECTVKTCFLGTCSYDDSNCESVCCFAGNSCMDGLTPQDCQNSGGQYLSHELTCASDPDNDGAAGCFDQCPRDPLKVAPGACGCHVSEQDTDGDGVADCEDCCTMTPSGEPVDNDGCPLVGACQSASGNSCMDGSDQGSCESTNGTYLGNGTTCEFPCVFCPSRASLSPDAQNPAKSRFISFEIVPSQPCESALRVRLASLHHVFPPYSAGASAPFTSFEGEVRWVGPPALYVESSSTLTPFYASKLVCAPHYQDWSTVGLLHVAGSSIVPSSLYTVEHVGARCMGNESNCSATSTPLTVGTARWGDVEIPYSPPSVTVQPDLADVSALVNKFRSTPGAPIKARALLAGEDAFGTISSDMLSLDFGFVHISACVDAFRGKPYPYAIESCP